MEELVPSGVQLPRPEANRARDRADAAVELEGRYRARRFFGRLSEVVAGHGAHRYPAEIVNDDGSQPGHSISSSWVIAGCRPSTRKPRAAVAATSLRCASSRTC